MNTKPISPKVHGLSDYALVASLVAVPRLLNFEKKIITLYTAEAMLLLGYVALTDQPAAVAPLIPFPVHGKIDPFNVAQFALQTLWKPFRKNKKAAAFNIAFTLVAGTVVALTNWQGATKKHLALQ